jgi:nucleotide-binding universal stress UspA family protein
VKDYRRILVPLDFSPGSRAALDQAIEMARVFTGSLSLLHVVVPPEYALGRLELLATVLDGVRASLDEERRHAIESEISNVETIIGDGPAARQIVHIADSGHYDLIVMGTHGRTGIDRLVVGSVAENVVRHAHCAVLTVRQR